MKLAKIKYEPAYIEKVALASVSADEEILRVLYYDCAPFNGRVKRPISGTRHEFKSDDQWLRDVAAKDLFAVRRGALKFRGWKPKTPPTRPAAQKLTVTDADFVPDFEQKGVDMRIGLDMATFSEKRSVDRIVLISADTDCVPAMKHVRKAGLQVVLIALPKSKLSQEMLWHADFLRRIAWPK